MALCSPNGHRDLNQHMRHAGTLRHVLPPQGAAVPGSVSLQQLTQGAAAGSLPGFFAAIAVTTRQLGWSRAAAHR